MSEMKSYWLYRKNEKVLMFYVNHGVPEIQNIENYDILPVFLKNVDGNRDNISADKFIEWIKMRSIPNDRIGLKYVEEKFGTDWKKGYSTKCCLTDQYWIGDGSTSWEAVNFFTNDYSKTVGKMFFEPYSIKPEELSNNAGPDLTTGGVMMKKWVQDKNKKSFLVLNYSPRKFLLEEGQNTSTALSVILSNFISGKLDLVPKVYYNFIISDGYLCLMSENICNEDVEFVPMQFFADKCVEETDTYVKIVKGVKKVLPDIEEGFIGKYVDNIIIHDAILRVNNRTLYDFGLLHDIETDEWSPSPILRVGDGFFVPQKNLKKKRGVDSIFAERERLLQRQISAKRRDLSYTRDSVKKEGLDNLINTYPGLTLQERGFYKANFYAFIGSEEASKDEHELR